MSKRSAAIEAMAKLLPDDHRERFFEIMSRFSKAPDDDEHMQLLEAIGFTAMITQRVPEEIAAIVEKMESGFSDAQFQSLQRRLETLLKNTIDTPSYKDLRTLVGEMKEEQGRFKTTVNALTSDITSIPAIPRQGTFSNKALVLCSLVSLIAGAVVTGAALLTKIPGDRLQFTFRPKTEHDDYVDYFEDNMPEFGGSVGIYVVSGEIATVAQEPDKGVIVVKRSKLIAP
ncbi:MAG: hypothetical protein GWQ05_07935 [Verrucomicrobiaceae bacterium]|nr:hypothetical protein [Verrucomicrobiaceae bacterium]